MIIVLASWLLHFFEPQKLSVVCLFKAWFEKYQFIIILILQ